jgi:phosphate:Na+ symporter
MSTTIAVLGGVGLFLLGMSVMTSGLKGLAGSSLRTTLRKAAATPLSGAFWGAFVTLIVQSSSATTMTTIGLVSAGLLTFTQGLGLVFGANVGTTGTAWLIALIGVRVSLTSAAFPMLFVGALVKLLGRGRISSAGAALAGFALVLYGLTTLQQGMSGLAETLHPSDLPDIFGEGVRWWTSVLGVLGLVALGLAMTAVMQSSTAAVAITLSAHFAGAIGLDQACALIIGQNIGTATSSAMAAIGASITAKRLAVAYILFKLIAALIALALFPFTTPLLVKASQSIDGVTLLAAYHTAYNVVGVAVLLPLIGWFTRVVERLLPERQSPLMRCLDPAALATPLAAEEAMRKTVARSLSALCASIRTTLAATAEGGAQGGKLVISTQDASDALRKTWAFMAEANGPPDSGAERERLAHTLHALDETYRLAGIAGEESEFEAAPGGTDDRAVELCAEAMRHAVLIGDAVGAGARPGEQDENASRQEVALALSRLEFCATELRELQRAHRKATLASIAGGAENADAAVAGIESARRLEAFSRHAWRSAAHLVDDAV